MTAREQATLERLDERLANHAETDTASVARLESKIDELGKRLEGHVADHAEAKRQAEDAKRTATAAAQLTAIQQRGRRTTFWAAVIGAIILGSMELAGLAVQIHAAGH